jgi:hypothetical protein
MADSISIHNIEEYLPQRSQREDAEIAEKEKNYLNYSLRPL